MSKIHELAFNAEEIDELLDSVDKKTIYQDATQSEHGLMSTTDKTKLDAMPTAQQIEGSLSEKVDKVEGKGLSENDYTDAEKGKVSSAYQKPQSGIPKTDLASNVQTSLGKADTAIQEHQDISGKANKDELVIVTGQGGVFDDKAIINLRTGVQATVLTKHQDITGKADKVSNATNGNFAGLDANGNLTDSGSKASDFATASQGAKADTAYQKPQAGIPESDLSSDVQQALQKHFKGWYDSSSNLPDNPVIGDYAYVKGAETTDPAAIYECTTDGSWSDSNRTADTSNVQTFASNQEVNEVHIVNDFTGGVDDVASAETVKTLDENKIDKQVTETTISYQDVTVETGYPVQTVLTASGGEYSQGSTSFKIIKCAIDPSKKYYLRGKTGSNTRPVYYFYDANDSAIGVFADYPNDTVATVYDNIIPPSNAAYIRLTGGITSQEPICKEIVTTTTIIQDNQAIIDSVGDVSELETTEKETVVGAINELANAIGDIGDVSGAVEKIDAIAETVVSPNMFDKSAMIDGYINSNTGNVASSSSSYKMSDYIPVLSNHYYYISGRTSNKVIRCLNADKSEVMRVKRASNETEVSSYNLPKETKEGTVINGQFKTPANAAYVQFNVIFATGDSADSLMLTDVGSTYNPNYVVPSYQPYGSSTKVKPSAIDCDDTPIEDSEKPITSGGVYEALQNVTPGATQPLKILLIGSSHGMNTIAQLPFIASKSGIPVIVGNVYQGSMSMQWMLGGALRSNYNFSFKLWSGGSWGVTQSLPMTNILKMYDWDYISIQRSASDDEVWTTTAAEVDALSSGVKDSLNINHYQSGATAEYLDHNKTLQMVIDFIKTNANNSPTILVNSNFTDSGFYATDKTNTYIIPSINKMKDNFGIEYYSTAIAMRNARGTFLQLLGNYINGTYPETSHNLTYDGQHIDYGIGCYLLSITLLGFILKMKGMGVETLSGYGTREEMNTNWWVSMSGDNIDRYTEPNEYTMACAKACAKAALLSPSQQNDTVKARFRWSVDYNLANGVTSSNDVPFSTHQDKYETTLTGVTSQTVTVTSQSSRSANPVDITSQVYDSSTGKITINSVEGDIVITVA